VVHNAIPLKDVPAVVRVQDMTFDPPGAAVGQVDINACFLRGPQDDRDLAEGVGQGALLQVQLLRLPVHAAT